MTQTPTHSDSALNHLAAVEAYADSLGDEWAKARPDSNDIKFLTASIGRGLKLAEIHATLNIGTQLERIADALIASPAAEPRASFLARHADADAAGGHWSGGKP